MVDCGATALFISEGFVQRNKVHVHPLNWKIQLCNIDRSENHVGSVLKVAQLRLRLGEAREWQDFLVTDLSLEELVLGLPWLRKVNPEIDWSSGTLNL